MTSEDVTAVRRLISRDNPFALGSQVANPAPAHVLNGFVAAALGSSNRGGAVRALLAGDKSVDLPLLKSEAWTTPAVVSDLRDDLNVAFNPDRRLWSQFGAALPVHGYLATTDPTDADYGPLMWQLVSRFGPPELPDRLKRMLMPATAGDSVTAVALVLSDKAEPGPQRTVPVGDTAWFGDHPTESGRALSESLATFVADLVDPLEDGRRVARIQTLARGLYFAALLALMLGPLARHRSDPITTVDELAPMVVWGDMPPGPAGHPMVMAAALSFQSIVDLQRAALSEVLGKTLEAQPVPSHLPEPMHLRERAKSLVTATGLAGTKLDSAVNRVVSLAGQTTGTMSTDEWSRRVIEAAYPEEFLTRGFRTMGRKVGFIGPDRGFGTPRFLCETPLLGTLVAGLCSRESREFTDFVDQARTRLGLILGPGSRDDLAEQLGLWEGAGVGRRILRDNEERLRQRLLRAGLAQEYSDGHTEVFFRG
jgi:hypothetical protein